ncbi:MAG: hypothetical protein FJ125_17925, partial [Deltaproteobacteria bacterium]|nr:hypothetical protein [Deltaproteobacteria bacterium]
MLAHPPRPVIDALSPGSTAALIPAPEQGNLTVRISGGEDGSVRMSRISLMKASLAIEAVRGSHHLDAPQHGRPIACLSLLLVLLATSCIPRLPLDDRCGVQSDCYEGELCLLPAGRCVPLAALTDGGGGLDSGRGEEDGGAGGEAGGPTPDAADAEVPDAGDAARPDGGPEQCDGLDDDGDGVVDEGCPCAPAGAAARPCGPPERGRCRPGEQRCLDEGVWGGCAEAVWPTAETCNGLDDDCDDLV